MVSGSNEWECTDEAAVALGFASRVIAFQNLALTEDPIALQRDYAVLYIAPNLSESDYGFLRQMSFTGGTLDRFVQLGGVAVINMSGNGVFESALAPGGVNFFGTQAYERERISLASHPFATGNGYGGRTLSPAEFDNWNTTDGGYLDNLPAGAAIILRNDSGPTLAEYNHGAGRVIVSTVNFCRTGSAPSRRQPLENLLRYAPFFNGLAQTPGLTATPTPTPTATETGRATATPSITPVTPATASPTATPIGSPADTPTPSSCACDCDGNSVTSVNELIRAVNIALTVQPVSACLAADGNGNGLVAINELIAGVNAALNGCP